MRRAIYAFVATELRSHAVKYGVRRPGQRVLFNRRPPPLTEKEKMSDEKETCHQVTTPAPSADHTEGWMHENGN